MKLLFVHQNFPAQYRYLAGALAREGGVEVVALGDAAAIGRREPLSGVGVVGYDCELPNPPGAHAFAQPFEHAVTRGHAVARACRALRAWGFEPDVIYAHPGWGEALFLRDVFPQARITLYCEFFYRATGADVGFDPEFPPPPDDALRVRAKNAAALLSMEAADGGISPTQWQRSVHPEAFRQRIDVIHDGIDTDYFAPDAEAVLELPGGAGTLTARNEIITYVARGLEPYRGCHTFMRALPRLQALRPHAHVVIVGGDGVSYGNPAPHGGSYREWLLAELDGRIDASRVHFLGRVPYPALRSVYQVSSAHVYLTYPFILSWSVLEAMSCGCAIVGSATAPVEEVIAHGDNGRLVDFFESTKLAEEIADVLEAGADTLPMRKRARQTVLERYDLARICLPAQLRAVLSRGT
ncbi:MAG: glycosyl transferase family 1 [Betaproteobacteria bacterium]|nr:glycosyl transferase family 1 [Betaproteobacteria bacterium]